jgi:hypothetical protein
MVILFKLVKIKFTFMKNDRASINEVLNLRQKQKRSKGMNNQL